MAYNKNSRTYDDVIVKEFWRDNDRFADLFNAVLFKGKCVIKADELQEMDTDVSGTIKVKDYKKLDIENPIIRINTAFKGCSSLEKISVLPRIYHN